MLRHCSVRTILATVFIVLAAGLCATLGWHALVVALEPDDFGSSRPTV